MSPTTPPASTGGPEQPRREDRTDDGQVKKHICSLPVFRWCPPFFWGWSPAGPGVGRPRAATAGNLWVVGTLQAHGGVRLLPCARTLLCFVCLLSTQRQHHVLARGTWDFVLPGAKRLNNTLHRRLTRKNRKTVLSLPCVFAGSSVSAPPQRLWPGAPWTVTAHGQMKGKASGRTAGRSNRRGATLPSLLGRQATSDDYKLHDVRGQVPAEIQPGARQ